jgi:hypothetical protein
VRKREGMRQHETLRHRLEGNIKTDLKEDMDWNHMAAHRDRRLTVVNMAVGFFFYFKQQTHTIVIRFTVIFLNTKPLHFSDLTGPSPSSTLITVA